MINSIIDPKLEIDDNNWVVSLVRMCDRDHAFVVVESKEVTKGLRIVWYDLLPHTTNRPTPTQCTQVIRASAVLFVTLQNHPTQGTIRMCAKNEGKPLVNVQSNVIKKDLFCRLDWDLNTNSFQCKADNVKKMIASIEDEMRQPPSFQARGGPIGVNCMTWAWQKLEIANIQPKKSHYNFFAVRPKKNIGSRSQLACRII